MITQAQLQPIIFVHDIDDPKIRENFIRLRDYIQFNNLLASNFAHLELTFTTAVTNRLVAHNLNFIPKDVFTTFVSAGTLTWNYSSFDATNISLTTTQPATIRAFLGSFKGVL